MGKTPQTNEFVTQEHSPEVVIRVAVRVRLDTVFGPVTGTAVLAPGDAFNIEAGRKLALVRAHKELERLVLRSGLSEVEDAS